MRARERLIESAPESDRVNLVQATLDSFGVDTDRLTKDQAYKLALEQIRGRRERYRLNCTLIAFVSVLAFMMFLFAMKAPASPRVAETVSSQGERYIARAIKPSTLDTEFWNIFPFEWASGKDGETSPMIRYVTVVELEVSFADHQYNQSPFINAIPRPALQSEGFTIMVDDLGDKASDRHRWIAFLGSVNRPGPQPRLVIGFDGRNLETELNLRGSEWVRHPLISDPEQEWSNAHVGVAIQIDRPHWPLVESAVWRKGVGNTNGLLLVAIRNFDDKPRHVREVQVEAGHPSVLLTGCYTETREQRVELRWKMADLPTIQGQTELRGTDVSVEGQYHYDSCGGGGSRLEATIPVDVVIGTNALESIGLVISEFGGHGNTPDTICGWRHLAIKAAPGVFPEKGYEVQH